LRGRLLRDVRWDFVIRLGEHGFDSPQAAGAFTALVGLTCYRHDDGFALAGLDAADEDTPAEKADVLHGGQVVLLSQEAQLANPDFILVIGQDLGGKKRLRDYADVFQGVSTTDMPRFVQFSWEQSLVGPAWEFFQMAPTADGIDGFRGILHWDQGRGELAQIGTARKGIQAQGRIGVAAAVTRDLHVTQFYGHRFDGTLAVVVPKRTEFLAPIAACFFSDNFRQLVREVDQALSVTESSFGKIRFDLAHWQRVAAEKYPNGLPEPDSNDPTQWLFNGRLADSTAPLQVGVARMLGYRWPRQTGQTVSGAPPVPEDGLEQFVDEDGIVCIPSVRGEAPAAERLRALLAAAYLPAEGSAQAGGKAWSPGKLDELLSAVDYAGSNLEDWLRNGFFEQHCKLFHHRPFIWQIWDGRKDGFSALVNYHKLDHKLLEKLTYTYLGDWIKKQQEAVAREESGADDRLLKAQQLQDKLKLILEGEAPYDIFVRWKPLEQQPIGWHPDLNDGVRLNIRPFMEADVLRKRPNIKWGVDRGKNPPGSPWGEKRDNDRHLTLAEKREARGK
jgi:hypothetical protein